MLPSGKQGPQTGIKTNVLFVIFILAGTFLVLPLIAGLSIIGVVEKSEIEASAGLREMHGTFAQFPPFLGLGLAIGLIVLFFVLAGWFGVEKED